MRSFSLCLVFAANNCPKCKKDGRKPNPNCTNHRQQVSDNGKHSFLPSFLLSFIVVSLLSCQLTPTLTARDNSFQCILVFVSFITHFLFSPANSRQLSPPSLCVCMMIFSFLLSDRVPCCQTCVNFVHLLVVVYFPYLYLGKTRKEDSPSKGQGKKSGRDTSHLEAHRRVKPTYICGWCGKQYQSGSDKNPIHLRKSKGQNNPLHPGSSSGRCVCHSMRICPSVL